MKRTGNGQKEYSFNGAKSLNGLSADAKRAPSLVSFKSCLQLYLAVYYLGFIHFQIYAPFTRERFHMKAYQDRTDRPHVYTGTDGTVPYRTASGTRTGPPRKYVPHGPEPKSSRVNSQYRSRQVRLETRQGFEEQMYGRKIFSIIFHVPINWRERLSFGTVHAWML